jgi:hypothetical protein
MHVRRRTTVGLALLVAVAAGFVGGHAIAAGSGTPANKVVAAGAKREVVAANQTATILSGTMRTSKPTDVMIQATLECSILTGLVTNNDNPSSSAHSTVRVWAEVDGKIVSLQQASTPPQNPTAAGNDSDKVTFCDREYARTVTDDENPLDGIDETDDYIRTKSAHGFNWVQMNLGSGIHSIVIKATLTTSTSGSATAEATIGNRTLIVEPTKMANDAVISDSGS